MWKHHNQKNTQGGSATHGCEWCQRLVTIKIILRITFSMQFESYWTKYIGLFTSLWVYSCSWSTWVNMVQKHTNQCEAWQQEEDERMKSRKSMRLCEWRWSSFYGITFSTAFENCWTILNTWAWLRASSNHMATMVLAVSVWQNTP